VLRAIMDFSARAISLMDRPEWASWITCVRMRRKGSTWSVLAHGRAFEAALAQRHRVAGSDVLRSTNDRSASPLDERAALEPGSEA
jgi:hypothetical protein